MLELRKITKSYRSKDFVQNALNEVSISFRENEFASILGASGSGKTTMLNIIGGLDQYDAGDLLIDGVSTKQYKSSDWDRYRNNRVGFVFQSYNLIPHQSILANVELALTLSGVSKKERKEKAVAALEEVGLKDHIYKLPTQLSGGQMQRVAIARALINDPEIVLADEPTGALDSNTSDQVMKLLEKIAQDRLVIMVTHNPELAHEYTNRIIELKDGEVIGDSNPYEAKQASVTKKEVKTKKKNMSFLTAISLSISNLMTKKGRTFITAVAGSIGIIGIAAILALASGINLYIEGIEQETMSAYPLTIDSSGIDITSFMGGGDDKSQPNVSEKPEVKEGELPVFNTITSMFSHQNKNDLKSFKTYIETQGDKINPYVKSIQYKYGITPEIFLENEKANLRQVNPDKIFSSYGFGEMGGLDMIAGAGDMGMRNFNELPGDPKLFETQYDVVAGRWPSSKEEAVVVLMDNGGLTDTTLYTLGLKDRSALEKLFEDFINNEEVKIEEDKHEVINYQAILDTKFKVINPAEKYKYDENYQFWVDQSDDKKVMDKIIKNGMDLKIVGVVQKNEETKTPMLGTGIYYRNDLTETLIKNAQEYDVVKAQLKDPKTNIFTGKPFEQTEALDPSELFKLEDFVTIDEAMIQNAFNFDTSAVDLDFSDFDLDFDISALPPLELEKLASSIAGQIKVPTEEIQAILTQVMTDFVKEQEANNVEDLEAWVNNFQEYINRADVQAQLIKQFEALNQETQIAQTLTTIIQNYFTTYMQESLSLVMGQVQNSIVTQVEGKMSDILGSLEQAFSVDTAMLAGAFEVNLEEEDFVNLIRSLTEQGQASASSNLRHLGYKDLSEPTQINL
ncbi:MAG TPA: ABC transporter ATP-binding protein, partial [Erysipelothrix sp.]